MNRSVRLLAAEHGLDEKSHDRLRLEFALGCAARTRDLLEDPDVIHCLDIGLQYLASRASVLDLNAAASLCKRAASSHRGSASIDGSGHAAVSASFGVSRALLSDAWNAAEYSAYAIVYAYAGYAVTEPSAFDTEYRWQLDFLKTLVGSENRLDQHSKLS